MSASHYREIFPWWSRHVTRTAASVSVIAEVSRGGYDLIVVGDYSCPVGALVAAYCRATRTPFLISTDGGFPKDDRTLLAWLKRSMLSGAEVYLGTGELASSYLKHYGVDGSRIWTYPFSSVRSGEVLQQPLGHGAKKELREELGIRDERMVLSVGSFTKRKGMDVLIRAAAEFPDSVGLHIVGGQSTQEYEDLVQRHNLTNVHFHPFFGPDELRRYYRASDCFALATREDIWGLVVGEAMAQAVPVVTTTRCAAGVELVVDGVNGYLVPPDDAKLMARRVMEVVDRSSLEGSMAQQALQTGSLYTVEAMVQSHVECFTAIAQRRS